MKWREHVGFLTEKTGEDLTHTGNFSIDPASLQGNVDNYIGIVQMPVGIAGPLLIDG